jgi:aspartyl-tRNA(Asn)/glutamyl-tRNA(Gln) amidotransferase subunit C
MITKEEIKKIASLAKIDISNHELDNYSDQISKILEYMSVLEEVDTSKIDESSSSVLKNNQLLREDKVEESLSRDEVMKLAPESDGVYFKVPKVIEGED